MELHVPGQVISGLLPHELLTAWEPYVCTSEVAMEHRLVAFPAWLGYRIEILMAFWLKGAGFAFRWKWIDGLNLGTRPATMRARIPACPDSTVQRIQPLNGHVPLCTVRLILRKSLKITTSLISSRS
jgi:hypothetical protein